MYDLTNAEVNFALHFVNCKCKLVARLYHGSTDAIESCYDTLVDVIMRCTRRYNPQNATGAAFRTYLLGSLRKSFFYWQIWYSKSTRKFDPMPESDRIPGGFNGVKSFDSADEIDKYLSQVPEFERTLIIRHFWYGETYRELGIRYNMSHAAIEQRVKSGIHEMSQWSVKQC